MKENFIICASVAILLAICLQLVMFIRLARRKDFGPLWENDLFSQKNDIAVNRLQLKIRIFGEEIKAYFSTVVGRCHIAIFVAFALTALVFAIASGQAPEATQ
ncbi:hypothetical protein GGQ73_001750 [Rhizobium skierniewicense]|uniref:Uncharacterized protein n=1 Tax=Rhizobium skierniewicense TaxID=984260 RepID=A0A7W6G1K9_9HYPH|nr:hypothetical protein [Rhizobium skierniewicense]MBB3945815.1 hypothetical protein [Rhizobium skierniewicense]NTF32393.1 hypothetical protein [Rhizobium skierniewicense]